MSTCGAGYWARLAKASTLVLVGIAVHLWIDGPRPAIHNDAGSAGISSGPVRVRASLHSRQASERTVRSDSAGAPTGDGVVEEPSAVATAGHRTPPPTHRIVGGDDQRDLSLYGHEAPHSASDAPAVARAGGQPDLPHAALPAVLLTRRLVGWSRDAAVLTAPAVPELAAIEPRRTAVVSDSPPAPAAAPVGSVAPRIAAAAAPLEEDSILQVLHEYEEAFGRKDPVAAKAVWPALDDRALARAFNGLQSHSLALKDCGVTLVTTNAAARARCQGIATYLPKIGRRKPISATHEWTFNLSKSGGDWQIESAAIR